MKRTLLYLPAIATIIFNLILVACKYSVLPSELPLHFDLDGNYTASMPSWRLFVYPTVSAAVLGIIYLFSTIVLSHSTKRSGSGWERGMAALAFCVCATILSSTCVTLTYGTNHFFMFAEPVLLLIGLTCVIVEEIRVRKR